MKKFYVVTLLLYSVIWSNARMLDEVAGYSVVHLLSLPREIRYFEIIFVSFFSLYSYFRSSDQKNRFEFLTAPYLLIVLGLLSGIINGVGFVDTFQGLYLYLSPLLIFFTARWLGLTVTEFRTMKKVIIWVLVINIPFWIYQVLTFFVNDGNGDNVNGLLRDAHLFAIFFYSAALYCFAYGILRKNLLWGGAAFILFLIGFVAFNEKATLFMIPIVIGMVIGLSGSSVRKTILPVFITGVMAYGAYSFGQNLMSKVETEYRTDVITENDLSDLGTVIAYIQLPLVFSEHPTALIYGVGSGNYGSSIALRKNVEGTATELSRKYVGDLEFAGTVGAFAWRTNYLIGLLVEFGLIFSMIILMFYYSMLKTSIKIFAKLRSNEERAILSYALGSMILLWMNALVSNISNLDEGILSYPVLIALAIIIGKNKH